MLKIAIAGAFALALSPALAQSPAPVQQPGNNAVNSSGTNNSSNPVEGANSFTEAQAKSRLEAQGYGSIGPLTKDDKGIWRGTATKGGSSVNVSVDFQGNVNAR
jgi:hypothetical protein